MSIAKCSRCKGDFPYGCFCCSSHPWKQDPSIPPKPTLDDYDERSSWPEPKYLDKEEEDEYLS